MSFSNGIRTCCLEALELVAIEHATNPFEKRHKIGLVFKAPSVKERDRWSLFGLGFCDGRTRGFLNQEFGKSAVQPIGTGK